MDVNDLGDEPIVEDFWAGSSVTTIASCLNVQILKHKVAPLDAEDGNDLGVELKEGDEVTVVTPGGSPYCAKVVEHQHGQLISEMPTSKHQLQRNTSLSVEMNLDWRMLERRH